MTTTQGNFKNSNYCLSQVTRLRNRYREEQETLSLMNLSSGQEVLNDGQSFLVRVSILRFGASVTRCQLHPGTLP